MLNYLYARKDFTKTKISHGLEQSYTLWKENEKVYFCNNNLFNFIFLNLF